MDIDRIKEKIRIYCSERNIVDLENQIRDNKRVIVNNISENILTLRNGFRDEGSHAVNISIN